LQQYARCNSEWLIQVHSLEYSTGLASQNHCHTPDSASFKGKRFDAEGLVGCSTACRRTSCLAPNIANLRYDVSNHFPFLLPLILFLKLRKKDPVVMKSQIGCLELHSVVVFLGFFHHWIYLQSIRNHPLSWKSLESFI
jgi:hypothetical protein